MIVADVRSRLTREDVALALALIAQHGAEARERGETTLHEEGLDPLLDDPSLLSGLLETPRGAHASLPLFAYVVVRQALLRSGERERVLADYAASILLHFGLRDRLAFCTFDGHGCFVLRNGFLAGRGHECFVGLLQGVHMFLGLFHIGTLEQGLHALDERCFR